MKVPATAAKHLGPHAVRLIEEYGDRHNLTNFREALVEALVELRTYETLHRIAPNQHSISTRSAPDQDTISTQSEPSDLFNYTPNELNF